MGADDVPGGAFGEQVEVFADVEEAGFHVERVVVVRWVRGYFL